MGRISFRPSHNKPHSSTVIHRDKMLLKSALAISCIVTAITAIAAQTANFNQNAPMLRSMTPEWVVGLYATLLEQNATDTSTKLFASALRNRAEAREVPGHLYEAIINELSGGVLDRSVQCGDGGCVVPLSLQKIWNYGCWCNMGQNLLQGVGQTVDNYDQACQSMQRCLRCAEIDASAGGYECDVKSTAYSASMTLNSQTGSMLANCDALNPQNPCGASLCMCETQFISEVIDNLWAGAAYASENLHRNGFERESTCMKGFAGQPVYECCGLYPKRFPFNVNQQACCTDDASYGRAYNFATQECCEGGAQIADLGNCI